MNTMHAASLLLASKGMACFLLICLKLSCRLRYILFFTFFLSYLIDGMFIFNSHIHFSFVCVVMNLHL